MRLGDVDPAGRLRFDALTRYTQDVSNDDTRDAALADALAWVVRRTEVDVRVPAQFDEELTFTTFCSGLGRRWAERRLHVVGSMGAFYEVATLWIHVDLVSGRPRNLSEQFLELYRSAAGDRHVSARLPHDSMPPLEAAMTSITEFDWPVRATDFDTIGHMNNAAYWAGVEQVLAKWPLGVRMGAMRVDLGYGAGIGPSDELALRCRTTDVGLDLWWRVGEKSAAAAIVVLNA